MVPHVTCVTLYPQDFFLSIIRILMLSCYFQEKQRSFTSGDFWVLPRWQDTHFSFSWSSKMAAMSNSRPWGHPGAMLKCQNPYPREGTLSQFPVGSLPPPPPPPPPPTWGFTLIGALSQLLHMSTAFQKKGLVGAPL